MTEKIRTTSFTLLEVLVASCIIGIFLGIILSGFSTTMKDSEIAAAYIKAAQLAEEKFNDIMLKKELTESEDSGVYGEAGKTLDWKTSIKKHGEKKEFTVFIEVSFGKGDARRTFTMRSFVMFPEKTGEKKKEDSGKQTKGDGPDLNS